MANYCFNRIEIRGRYGEIARFVDAARKGDPAAAGTLKDGRETVEFDFNRLVPQPHFEEELGGPEPGETPAEHLFDKVQEAIGAMPARDWYSWRVANWGTKWSPKEVDVFWPQAPVADADPTVVRLDMFTAWSPPTAFFRNAALKFPDLVFIGAYSEPSNEVHGAWAVCADRCVQRLLDPDPCFTEKDEEADFEHLDMPAFADHAIAEMAGEFDPAPARGPRPG